MALTVPELLAVAKRVKVVSALFGWSLLP